jgi:GNAT superfamily N-acetyltransferase
MFVPYHPPLHATADLARRVERAEIDFCAAASVTDGRSGAASLEVGGGRALYSAPDSPLNKMLGLGLAADVSEADLDAIEAFYRVHHAPARVELCPLVPTDLPSRLASRGYVLQGFENELARRLPLAREEAATFDAEVSSTIRVERTLADEDERWVRAVAEGFAAPEPHAQAVSPDAVDHLVSIMRPFTHDSIERYLAWAGGAIAGGGATFLCEGVLGIFGTATVPRFRRQGVQTALVVQALKDGGSRSDVAIATTEPGSASQRTFERLGFRVIYTRAILVLPLHDPMYGSARTT